MDIETFRQKLLSDTEQPLTEKSVTSYVAGLRRVERIFGKSIYEIDFNNSKIILEKLGEHIKNKNSMKIVVITIVRYLRFTRPKNDPIIQTYVAEHMAIKNNIQKVEIKNELKPKEKDVFIDFIEMKNIFKDFMKNNTDTKRIEHIFLLGTLLLSEAPTRLGNYNTMEIIKVNPTNYSDIIDGLDYEKNYLVVIETEKITNYIYVFNKYKTASSIGTIHMKVEDPLLKQIITLLLIEKKGQYLFKYSTSYMTQMLRTITEKIYGEPFSVDLIRHSFITWFFGTNPTTEEKINRLKIFGNVYKPNQADLYLRIIQTEN